MNPHVRVEALAELPATIATSAARLADFHILVLCGQSAHVIHQADKACSIAGIGFFAANSRGICGWAFANLHEHKYILEVRGAGV